MKKKNIIKKILITLLIIVIIIVLATIGIGNYFVNYAILRTGNGGDREVKNTEVVEVASIDNEIEKIIEKNRKQEKQLASEWSNTVKNKKVEVTAKDGITLKGTEYINDEQTNNWVIVLHCSSMGAATVLMASGDELSSNVKTIIEDSGYTTYNTWLWTY